MKWTQEQAVEAVEWGRRFDAWQARRRYRFADDPPPPMPDFMVPF